MTLAMILAACGTFQAARTAALDGHYPKAEKILNCRIKASPKETDSKILLADLKWWKGENSKSRELSAAVLAGPEVDTDTQFRLNDRVNRWRLDVSALTLFSQGQTGLEAGVGLRARVGEDSSIGMTYQHLNRSYGDGVLLSDNLIGINTTVPMGRSVYVEGLMRFAVDAKFSAEQVYRVEPHYVFANQNDFSIALQLSIYIPQTYLPQVEFAWQYPVTPRWTIFTRVYIAMPSQVLPSALVGSDVAVTSRFKVRAAVGGGRSYDGDGLVNDLFTVSLTPSYRVNRTFSIEAPVSADFGSLRNEVRIGLGGQCRF